MGTFCRFSSRVHAGGVFLIVFLVLLVPSAVAKTKNSQEALRRTEWLGIAANNCRTEPASGKIYVFNHYIYRSHCNTTENITVEIGGVGLAVPRGSSSFQTRFEPQVIHNPGKECNVRTILGLTRLDIGGASGLTLSPSLPLTPDRQKSAAYPRLDENIKRWGDPERSCLANGTMRLWRQEWGVEWYFLPIKSNPTADQRPVAFVCSRIGVPICEVSYNHPDGLHFSYKFLREHVTEDEYVAYDLHWRKLYEHMLVKDTSVVPRNDPFTPIINISK